jgi:hydrogenase/urease accessory protein HupE
MRISGIATFQERGTGYVTIDPPGMQRFVLTAAVAAFFVQATPASAHPVPFSYLDLHLQPGSVELSIVVHMFDAGHDLQVDPADRLLDPAFLATKQEALIGLLAPRIQVSGDGTPLVPLSWSAAEALPDRQSVRIRATYEVKGTPGTYTVDARMFPYDSAHQTFVNVYEGDMLTLQAILDVAKTRLDYYSGSRQGVVAVARRFIPAGLRHVWLGPDHLLFLLGVLLLGGTMRQLAWLAAGFAAGNLMAFVLILLSLLHPAPRLIEPAIALSIVYIGADNLMVRGGRDMRVWIATAFGLVHGFWFANGLREMDLPTSAFRWSLASFDIGVEVAQILTILTVGAGIAAFRRRSSPEAGRRLVYAGSAAVIMAGVYLFVQRVFFPGGIV